MVLGKNHPLRAGLRKVQYVKETEVKQRNVAGKPGEYGVSEAKGKSASLREGSSMAHTIKEV